MGISKWNAGIIRPVAVAPTGPYQNSSAPGVWTLDQQAYWDKQNLWPTAGSVDPSLFIENLFSTYLYTGTGSNFYFNNGVDVNSFGGLELIKSRSQSAANPATDAGRWFAVSKQSSSSNEIAFYDGATATTNAATSVTAPLWFTSSGNLVSGSAINTNGATYVSWTFRKQAKFFDVVTYTGDGTSVRSISHNLGSTPGFIIVKRMDATGDWSCYHRSLGVSGGYIRLNSTAAASGTAFSTPINSTVFSIESGAPASMNVNGGTYVAYLFAHDAGGFGPAGTDNVISCGSFTSDGSGNATINLGYEPQWILLKTTGVADAWYLYDTMRGITAKDAAGNAFNAYVSPNSANAETTTTGGAWSVNQTGFQYSGGFSSRAFIYIAIRRGPMKTPTSGTSVFTPATRTGTGAAVTVTGAAFPPDFLFNIDRLGTGPAARYNYDRLRGAGQTDLRTNSAAAEGSAGAIGVSSFNMNGFSIPSTGVSFLNSSSASYINYFFQRAPGFFDMVCFTQAFGTQNHNLQVAPELVILKSRSTVDSWYAFVAQNGYGVVNQNGAWVGLGNGSGLGVNLANVTSTTLSNFGGFGTGNTAVAYLFASCPGVSKVGSYTGTGALQTINCGFASGARFVLIKRTDSTGDWWVYDSARGITSGNDPYLFLNTSTAEDATTNYVDTTSVGFQVTAAAPAELNAVGGTYIFLAIS